MLNLARPTSYELERENEDITTKENLDLAFVSETLVENIVGGG